MAKIIRSPNPLPDGFSVFLAGSIELGNAGNWQEYLEFKLANRDIFIFNPRRNDWDSSWTQSREDTHFYQQVEWELNALEKANIIVMYFDPATKSPVSLLELGLFGHTGKMIVCCPEGFWRKGNVDIVCEKYSIKQVDLLEEVIEYISVLAGRNG